MLRSLYIEGNTPFHRLPVRVKLITLMTASIALFFVSSLQILVPTFVTTLCLYLALGLPWREAC